MPIVPSPADLPDAAAAPSDSRTLGAQPAEGRAFDSEAPGSSRLETWGTDTQPIDIAAVLAAS